MVEEVSSMVQSEKAKEYLHQNTRIEMAARTLKDVVSATRKFDTS